MDAVQSKSVLQGTMKIFILNEEIMKAEIIAIGTELLLGEIVDTNTRFIARALREVGLDLHRTSAVGDNAARIAQVVQESANRADVVITTGGLGPTIDDPTREAIAQAAGQTLVFHDALWAQIQEKFSQFGSVPTENNRRQAYIPSQAEPLDNPAGSAPGFITRIGESLVVSLPGVPAEMEQMLDLIVLPYLKKRLKLDTFLRTRILRVAGVGESWLDERIQDLEKMTNPTVGLAAHPGQIDIRITAKASTEREIEEGIAQVEATLRQRLGGLIFGADDETLPGVVMASLKEKNWPLRVLEYGTGGILQATLADIPGPFAGGEFYRSAPAHFDLLQALHEQQQRTQDPILLGLVCAPAPDHIAIQYAWITPEAQHHRSLKYGGPPPYAPRWAASYALNSLRKSILG